MESDKKTIVKKRGTPLKRVIFKKEREEIRQKLDGLLGLTENNRKFVLAELENNVNVQIDIVNLEEDVRKYFVCGSWAYFMSENGKKRYFSLLRSIYKDMGYDVKNKVLTLKKDGYYKNTKEYEVIKKS